MGQIVGGIGSSHAPSFGAVYDKGQQKDPTWAPLFDGYVPVRAWLDRVRPDLFIIVYNVLLAAYAHYIVKLFWKGPEDASLPAVAIHPIVARRAVMPAG